MIKREDLKQVATPVLQKKYKTFKIAIIVLVTIVSVMGAISVLNWQANGLSPTVLLPVFFIPMVIVNYLSFKRIKDELRLRMPSN